jgi:hypothetical protein
VSIAALFFGGAVAAVTDMEAASISGCSSKLPSNEYVKSTESAVGVNYALAKGDTMAVGYNQNGLLQAFAVRADGCPITSSQTTIPNPWSSWSTFGANGCAMRMTSRLAVATNVAGTLEVFGRGTDNAIWHAVQNSPNAATWSNWTSLSGGIASDPAVVIDGNSNLDVYGVGWNDARPWHITQSSPGSWANSGWSLVNGTPNTVRSNLAVARVDGSLLVHVVARGTDSFFHYIAQTSVGSWAGANWASMPSSGNVPLLWDPVVCRTVNDTLDVFGVTADSNQNVLHTWINGSQTMGSWENLGGFISSGVGCGSGPNGDDNVFGLGGSRHLYVDNRPSGGGWSGWIQLTPASTYSSAPVALPDSNFNLEVFLRGASNDGEQVYQSQPSVWNATPFSLGRSVGIISPPENPPNPLPAVTTQHNDNNRSGVNTNEPLLNVFTVNQNQFGQSFSVILDGNICAQPLYVPAIRFSSGACANTTRNVVYVATEHNSVYAIDADSTAGTICWHAAATAAAGSPNAAVFGLSVPYPYPDFGNGSSNQALDCQNPAPSYNYPEIGITGTPAIDLATATMYVVAFDAENFTPQPYSTFSSGCAGGPTGSMGTCSCQTWERFANSGHTYAWKLHAIDITTGAEKTSINGHGVTSPVAVSVSGAVNAGCLSSPPSFTPQNAFQRPALAIYPTSNAQNVYVGFGSLGGDAVPWNGWLFSYGATTLSQAGTYLTSPKYSGASLWSSGQGPVVDANGAVYFATANNVNPVPMQTSTTCPLALSNAARNTADLGDSFVKVVTTTDSTKLCSGSIGLSVQDWFTPYDGSTLSNTDTDLASSGPLLLPGTQRLLGGGKFGRWYLLNTQSNWCTASPMCGAFTCGMGGQNVSSGPDSQVVQYFSATPNSYDAGNGTWGAPVYWKSPGGAFVYGWGNADNLKQYGFNGSTLSTAPTIATGTSKTAVHGAFLSASAWNYPGCSGGCPIAGTGIIWATESENTGFWNYPTAGTLHAYDASNVATPELWNSGNSLGNVAKFVSPTVANGKVYMASVPMGMLPPGQWSQGQLIVYGPRH